MNTRGHLSSETLDLLSLSALRDGDAQQAREHLGACTDCQHAWEELEGDRQRFSQFVFPRTLENVEARARPRRKWTLMLPLAGLIAAAVLVVWVLPTSFTPSLSRGDQPSYVGIKGGARLDVVALRGDRQLSVGNDTILAPGDRIRFLVESAGARFVIVASKDGRGDVTVYYPYDGAQSAALQAGFQELPGSIELDAVGGREKVVAVFSDQPVATDEVRKALEHDADLSKLPGVRSVATKEFVKETR